MAKRGVHAVTVLTVGDAVKPQRLEQRQVHTALVRVQERRRLGEAVDTTGNQQWSHFLQRATKEHFTVDTIGNQPVEEGEDTDTHLLKKERAVTQTPTYCRRRRR